MLQQNDLDTKQLITDLTNLLTRGVDKIVGNNIKKREILERKQQYVTETLTQLLLKLEDDDLTEEELKNKIHPNLTQEMHDAVKEKEEYLSNYLIYKQIETSLLKADDSKNYLGQYLSVHGPHCRYLHETCDSAFRDENRHASTFTGIIGNENLETKYAENELRIRKRIPFEECLSQINLNKVFEKENLIEETQSESNSNCIYEKDENTKNILEGGECNEELSESVTVSQEFFPQEHETQPSNEITFKEDENIENESKEDELNEKVFKEDELNEKVFKEDENIENESKEDEINEKVFKEDDFNENESKEEQKEDEEEEELFEIQIGVTTYATDNEINGKIYALVEDGDVGDKVGYFKDGKAFFHFQ